MAEGVQRLKTRPQFQAVLAGGIVSRTPHFALHRLSLAPVAESSDAARMPTNAAPETAPAGDAVNEVHGVNEVAKKSFPPLFSPPSRTWLGAMVPKRWARRAVTRNSIKRQIYTLGGEIAPLLAFNTAYVVRLRTAFDRSQFVSASSDLLKSAVRAELQLLLQRVTR